MVLHGNRKVKVHNCLLSIATRADVGKNFQTFINNGDISI